MVYNATTDGGVLCILHSRAVLMSGSTVMGVQCDQDRVEHTALGGSDANPKCLASIIELQTEILKGQRHSQHRSLEK